MYLFIYDQSSNAGMVRLYALTFSNEVFKKHFYR